MKHTRILRPSLFSSAFARVLCLCMLDSGCGPMPGGEAGDPSQTPNPLTCGTDAEGGSGLETSPTIWYRDLDGDGYGDPTAVLMACQAPAGFIAIGSDCDDEEPRIHPQAPENCTDAIDDDCSSVAERCTVDDWFRPGDADLKLWASTSSSGTMPIAGGDLNGDGMADLVVGFWDAAHEEKKTGVVWIFYPQPAIATRRGRGGYSAGSGAEARTSAPQVLAGQHSLPRDL